MDSPENVEAEPRHEAFTDDRGNSMEKRVPPSASAEDKEEGRNGDHFRESWQRSSKESPAKNELWRESSHKTSSKDKDIKDRTREKDEGTSSSISEKHHSGWSKAHVVRKLWVLMVTAKDALGHEEGEQAGGSQEVA